ncbi:MAG: nucleotidyltransferase family protein, partial [Synergistaceae bacterium]|nr:nucleotidyltransferase family protein [Synergistaceae bacterium]
MIDGARIGIVAEHDPFHEGHRRNIEAARAAVGGGRVVVALSSSFVQRGEPALVDKWARAEMALACGADLVVELPFPFACAAAPDFAAGGVDVLARSGLVTHLAFGMERPWLDLDALADVSVHEPPAYRSRLREGLEGGASWARAATSALEEAVPSCAGLRDHPNDLLALSYVAHIRRCGYDVVPVPLPRQGGAHGDVALERGASASALRAAVRGGVPSEDARVMAAMPPASLTVLRREREEGRLSLSLDAMWTMARAVLLRSSAEDLRRIDGMDEGIEGALSKRWKEATGLEDLIERCASPRWSRARLRRLVVRMLVGLDRWTARAIRRVGPPYVRVLGWGPAGREMSREARGAPLPVVG